MGSRETNEELPSHKAEITGHAAARRAGWRQGHSPCPKGLGQGPRVPAGRCPLHAWVGTEHQMHEAKAADQAVPARTGWRHVAAEDRASQEQTPRASTSTRKRPGKEPQLATSEARNPSGIFLGRGREAPKEPQ